MPVYVAMLRSVNAGGNPLKMQWLREACTELGFADVQTYLQSGNLVLSSKLGAEAVAKKLKATGSMGRRACRSRSSCAPRRRCRQLSTEIRS
jgi:uncharacterized protein (DUF1697 family)